MKKFYMVILLLLFSSGLYAREFLNTVLHLNFGGMYTFANDGDIIDEEKSEINDYFTDPSTSHYTTAYSFTLDIAPMSPVMLGLEEHAIKVGVRGAYRFHFLQQKVKSEGAEYGDQVMDYKSWMIGPVVHYAPFVEPSSLDYEYTASGGFTFYALFGKIDGDLTAFPSIRDAGGPVGNSNSKITGNKIDIGVGAEIALCTVNFGVNIYYTRINYEMKEEIYAGAGRKGTLNEGCMELYFGIPVEFIIRPFIPRF